ncbi:MAG: response regulator [Gemmataceae bacterium]
MNESLRIAVADDEPDMREYFRRVLPRLGHRVVCLAQDGADLVRQCREAKPDIVITDIRMEPMDGFTAADEITNERPVPIIIVSAYYDPELVARAKPDRIQGYLVKPVKQADLGPALQLAMARFKHTHPSEASPTDLRDALIDGLAE